MIENSFTELPFVEVSILFQKVLRGKKHFNRVRTLMVINYLMSRKNQEVLNWFHTVDVSFEKLDSFALMPIVLPYYNYLKLRSRFNSTILLLLSSANLENIKNNPHALFQKAEELISLAQSLISLKDPLVSLLKAKKPNDISPEITTYVLADSEAVYQALKNAVGCLWQIFSGFDGLSANRGREIFVRYNNFVASLKEFAGKCPEEYPGSIPRYMPLSEKTMEQVAYQVTGKENLGLSTNLINFEAVERDGSPLKKSQKVPEAASPPKTQQLQNVVFNTHQPMQMMPGYPMPVMYPQTVFYSQPYFYQPFPNNNR